jgi:(S)-3,5-dihydroxyphenylglycine transaminase
MAATAAASGRRRGRQEERRVTTRSGIDALLLLDDLHPSLRDESLDSMNFLNEVSTRYPDAISFAAGRPYEGQFDVELVHLYLREYRRYLIQQRGFDAERVRRAFFQYGPTKGLITELVARNLELDEGIRVDPESIVVTVGCQEAIVLALRALRADERDVVLAVTPTYVGLTGAARLVDMPVIAVRSGPEGIDLDDLADQVRAARESGLRPRACYLLPDFSNPEGVSLDLPTRRALLDLADDQDLLLLEDNPYGLFGMEDERPPTLKALDDRHRVVYLGSFAKTGLPGARVGYAVADQQVARCDGTSGLFADELSKIKSMLTVNTSPIAQAVIAGKLLCHGCSLIAANAAEIGIYRRNLTHILDGLSRRFADRTDVTWNIPRGGFFLVMTVPFVADDAAMERSARDFGVLWTPMHHFYPGSTGMRQLRLSCSLLDPELIDEGLDRLAAFIADHPPT